MDPQSLGPRHPPLSRLLPLFLALHFSGSATAADTWSDPYPGIRLLQRVESGSTPQRITAAFVDVCEPGLRAQATRYGERRQTTSAWASDVGALVAVNGGFFSYTDYDVVGYSVGEGEVWPTGSDWAHGAAIAFASRGRVELFDPDRSLPIPGEDWWAQIVPGDPLLIDDGLVVSEACYSHMCERHPRTAVGLASDGRTTLLVTVDGRTSGASGMTRSELADLMLDLGAFRALNLDGGGSTAIYLQGSGVLNRPSDGSERVVASHLGFVQDPDAPPCCLPEALDGASGTFADVRDDAWYLHYAETMYERGVSEGCQAEPRLFCPDCVLDRATYAVLLQRALELPLGTPGAFEDLPADDWRAPSVAAIAEAGLTSGCSSSPPLFCPDRFITRYEAATLLARAMGLAPVESPSGLFVDLSSEQAPLMEALAAACVTSGCSADHFCPDQELSRAEAAAFLVRGLRLDGEDPCGSALDTGESGGPVDSGSASGETAEPNLPDPTDSGTTDSASPAHLPHEPGGDRRKPVGCAGGAFALGLLFVWGRRRSFV